MIVVSTSTYPPSQGKPGRSVVTVQHGPLTVAVATSAQAAYAEVLADALRAYLTPELIARLREV